MILIRLALFYIDKNEVKEDFSIKLLTKYLITLIFNKKREKVLIL